VLADQHDNHELVEQRKEILDVRAALEQVVGLSRPGF
jgi:hypothetical protein